MSVKIIEATIRIYLHTEEEIYIPDVLTEVEQIVSNNYETDILPNVLLSNVMIFNGKNYKL